MHECTVVRSYLLVPTPLVPICLILTHPSFGAPSLLYPAWADLPPPSHPHTHPYPLQCVQAGVVPSLVRGRPARAALAPAGRSTAAAALRAGVGAAPDRCRPRRLSVGRLLRRRRRRHRGRSLWHWSADADRTTDRRSENGSHRKKLPSDRLIH